MVRFGKADHEIARLLEEEFKKFVILTLIKPGVAHAPPGAVDMYWHFFILHSEQYSAFCEEVWGNFKGIPSIDITTQQSMQLDRVSYALISPHVLST
jgi:hypothetical protein